MASRKSFLKPKNDRLKRRYLERVLVKQARNQGNQILNDFQDWSRFEKKGNENEL